MKDPYGVPTGSVPRMHTNGYQRTEPLPPDPVAKAIEQYLLMERKARAWDALLRTRADPTLIAEMNAMVHPAQEGNQQSPIGTHE